MLKGNSTLMVDTNAVLSPPKVEARSADPEESPRKSRQRRAQGNLWALWFLLPAGVFLLFSVAVPSVQGAIYAFTDWNGLSADWNFIGLENFADMLSDPLARTAIFNSLLLTLITTVGQNVIGLLLALALSSRIRARGFLRVLIFAPCVVTPVVVAFLWQYILLPDGPLNGMLNAIGMGWATQTWLGDPQLALISISFVILWQMSGAVMVIYIAGLQSVPDELLEAAALDGAGPVRRFFAVTLPALRPAVVIATLLCIVGGLKTFDQVWVMTRGGPGVSSQVLSTAIYQTAFLRGDFSYATALALVLALITIVAAAIQQRVARAGTED
jgi:raffinose/stachyose/melibiose transport system permease protein